MDADETGADCGGSCASCGGCPANCQAVDNVLDQDVPRLIGDGVCNDGLDPDASSNEDCSKCGTISSGHSFVKTLELAWPSSGCMPNYTLLKLIDNTGMGQPIRYPTHPRLAFSGDFGTLS